MSSNPEKGPGKLGHEGKGNERPTTRPSAREVAKKLGEAAVRGSKGK